LMFQDFALFPHRDVFGNVAFGLQMARLPRHEIRERVTQALELVGLPSFERRDVNTLSGGESQRVALARSLAPRPRLLMLDEPLGSLDRNLRERLVDELRGILRGSRQTAVYVTHDQEEAFAIADRVVVMNAGQVMQTGAPQEIYRRPACAFVARFLGLNNLLEGVVQGGERGSLVHTPLGDCPISGDLRGNVTVLLRPDAVRLDGKGDFNLEGIVRERSFRGGVWRLEVTAGGLPLTFDFPSSLALPEAGEKVTLSVDPTAVQAFAENGCSEADRR